MDAEPQKMLTLELKTNILQQMNRGFHPEAISLHLKLNLPDVLAITKESLLLEKMETLLAQDLRQHSVALIGEKIKHKAHVLYNKMKVQSIFQGVQDEFEASDNWLDKFVKRNELILRSGDGVLSMRSLRKRRKSLFSHFNIEDTEGNLDEVDLYEHLKKRPKSTPLIRRIDSSTETNEHKNYSMEKHSSFERDYNSARSMDGLAESSTSVERGSNSARNKEGAGKSCDSVERGTNSTKSRESMEQGDNSAESSVSMECGYNSSISCDNFKGFTDVERTKSRNVISAGELDKVEHKRQSRKSRKTDNDMDWRSKGGRRGKSLGRKSKSPFPRKRGRPKSTPIVDTDTESESDEIISILGQPKALKRLQDKCTVELTVPHILERLGLQLTEKSPQNLNETPLQEINKSPEKIPTESPKKSKELQRFLEAATKKKSLEAQRGTAKSSAGKPKKSSEVPSPQEGYLRIPKQKSPDKSAGTRTDKEELLKKMSEIQKKIQTLPQEQRKDILEKMHETMSPPRNPSDNNQSALNSSQQPEAQQIGSLQIFALSPPQMLPSDNNQTAKQPEMQQRNSKEMLATNQVASDVRRVSDPILRKELSGDRQNVAERRQEVPIQSKPAGVHLVWNHQHHNMINVISSLMHKERYVDVTLCCEKQKFQCHKLILSASSVYFDEILSDIMQMQYPVIIIHAMSSKVLSALIKYMYEGEVIVEQGMIDEVLQAAETLKIKGLQVRLNGMIEKESAGGESQEITIDLTDGQDTQNVSGKLLAASSDIPKKQAAPIAQKTITLSSLLAETPAYNSPMLPRAPSNKSNVKGTQDNTQDTNNATNSVSNKSRSSMGPRTNNPAPSVSNKSSSSTGPHTNNTIPSVSTIKGRSSTGPLTNNATPSTNTNKNRSQTGPHTTNTTPSVSTNKSRSSTGPHSNNTTPSVSSDKSKSPGGSSTTTSVCSNNARTSMGPIRSNTMTSNKGRPSSEEIPKVVEPASLHTEKIRISRGADGIFMLPSRASNGADKSATQPKSSLATNTSRGSIGVVSSITLPSRAPLAVNKSALQPGSSRPVSTSIDKGNNSDRNRTTTLSKDDSAPSIASKGFDKSALQSRSSTQASTAAKGTIRNTATKLDLWEELPSFTESFEIVAIESNIKNFDVKPATIDINLKPFSVPCLEDFNHLASKAANGHLARSEIMALEEIECEEEIEVEEKIDINETVPYPELDVLKYEPVDFNLPEIVDSLLELDDRSFHAMLEKP